MSNGFEGQSSFLAARWRLQERVELAQNNLGWTYANGRGVARDDAQAVAWYRKAADQGYAFAQNNLGVMYKNGRGVAKDDVTKDEAQAVEWLRKAAEQGRADDQYKLGERYADGRGVAQDAAQAVAWWRKAAEQGKGPMDGAAFETYVRTQLALTLERGEVVIWDNLNVHKSQNAFAAVKERGAWVLFLPRYSPDIQLFRSMIAVGVLTPLWTGERCCPRSRSNDTARSLWQVIARGADVHFLARLAAMFSSSRALPSFQSSSRHMRNV